MNHSPKNSPPADATGQPLWEALATGRQQVGLTPSDVAGKLKVSVSLVEAMEQGNWERLGARVYASGYLHSYAKLVGVPAVKVDTALARMEAPSVPLQTSNYVPRARFQAERYARRVASIVLTASIVVPVVWLATEQRLPLQPGELQSLDEPVDVRPSAPLSIAEMEASRMGPPEADKGERPSTVDQSEQLEVVASFAPFLSARKPAESTVQAVDTADEGWTLTFSGDSWVEIIGVDGERLEYGIVRAGSERQFEVGQLSRVALGNASVVSVRRDGETVDIGQFQRANVARFAVSSSGELIPTGG